VSSETVNESSPSPSREDGAKLATARPERNSVVPPYWQRHERNGSRLSSYTSDAGARIVLEDHTDESSEQCKVLWAKHVTIDDYVVVSGTAPGLGAYSPGQYVVWNCTVETLDVSPPRASPQLSTGIRGPHIGSLKLLPRSQSLNWRCPKGTGHAGNYQLACISPFYLQSPDMRNGLNDPLTNERAVP
jgi:hypothetical protein